MKKTALLLLTLFVVLGLNAQPSRRVAPDFTATSIDGDQIHLYEILQSGKHVLIDFFFTTCGPCIQAIPHVVETYHEFGCNQHDVFYMEITDRSSAASCQSWEANYGVEYPTIASNYGAGICSSFGIEYFPTIVLIAPDGQIIYEDIVGGTATIIERLESQGIRRFDCETGAYTGPGVEITLGQVTTNSIEASFAPNDGCAKYKAYMATPQQMSNYAILMNLTPEQVVAQMGTEYTAATTRTWSNLTPATNYNLYALPYNGSNVQFQLTTLPAATATEGGGGTTDPAEVQIAVGDLTPTTAQASFTPNAHCASYWVALEQAAVMEFNAEMNYSTIEEMVAQMGYGHQMMVEGQRTWENLQPETEYTVYAVPMNADGTMSTMATAVLTTPAAGGSSPEVAITLGEVTATTVTASFAPNADCASYWILLSTQAELDQWSALMGATTEQLVQMWGIEQTAAATYTWDEQTPGTEYTVYALPIGAGNAAGTLATQTAATTTLGGPGEALVEIAVTVETPTSVRTIATPNDQVAEYHYGLIPASLYDELGAEAAADMFRDDNYPLYQADNFLWTIDILPDTEYYALGTAKNANGEWGATTLVPFVTTMGDFPAVEITVGAATSQSVSASFAPSAGCASYWALADEAANVEFQMAWLGITTVEAYVLAMGQAFDAAAQHTWEGLAPSTEYTIYALPVGGTGLQGALATATITTLPAGAAGEARVDIAIAETGADFARTVATPNAEAQEYHYAVLDAAQYGAMTAEAVAEMLRGDNRPLDGVDDHTWTGLQPATAYVAAAVARNSAGEWGAVTAVPFSTQAATAVNDITAAALSVYPNPASDMVTIAADGLREVVVTNQLGQIVGRYQADGDRLTIATTEYPAGVYFVLANQTAAGRFVVAR